MKYSLIVCPAAGVDLARGVDQVFVGDELVDDAAHAFGGGFGRERKSAGAAVLEFFHQINGNRFNSQGGQ